MDPSENIYEIQRAAPRRRKIGRRVQQKNNASKYGVWVGGKPCRNVTWVSDKQVECIVPPGAGDAKIVVRAPADQGVAARGANLTIEYDGPVIRMIGPNSGENGGAYDMEILGKNFGEVKPKSIVAFVGEAKCLKTTWFSDAMIVCRVPPSTGTNEKVTVVVNGKKSAIGKVGALPFKPAFFSYEAPVVASVLPKDGPAVGGVLGANVVGDALGASVGATVVWDVVAVVVVVGVVVGVVVVVGVLVAVVVGVVTSQP